MSSTEYINGKEQYYTSGPQSELDIALYGKDPKFDSWGFPTHPDVKTNGSFIDLYNSFVHEYGQPAFTFWQWAWIFFTVVTVLAILTTSLKGNRIHNFFYEKLYSNTFACMMIVALCSFFVGVLFNIPAAKLIAGTFVISFMIHVPIWIVIFLLSWILGVTIMPLIYKIFGVCDKYF